MSEFALNDLGEGRFELSGEVSFHTAEDILGSSEKLFTGLASVEVDLSNVKRTDSAGLALLLEWIRRAGAAATDICFANIPEKIHAIAVTADVDELLERSYSSYSSKK